MRMHLQLSDREIMRAAKGMGIVEQKQIILCPHCHAFLGYGTFSVG